MSTENTTKGITVTVSSEHGLYSLLENVREKEVRLFAGGFVMQEGNTIEKLKNEAKQAWDRDLTMEEAEAFRRGFSEGVFRAIMTTDASDLKRYLKEGCFRTPLPIHFDGIG